MIRLGLGLVGLWLVWSGVLLAWRGYHVWALDSPPRVSVLLPDDPQTCLPPCWQGLRPMFSTEEDIRQHVMTLPQWIEVDRNFWTFQAASGHQYSIWFGGVLSLVTDKYMRLGDWFAALGAPDYYTLRVTDHIPTGQEAYFFSFYYERLQVVMNVTVLDDQRLDVQSRVVSVEYRDQYFARPFYSCAKIQYAWVQEVICDDY